MKKIFSTLAILSLLLSMGYSANAGHNENTRKKCRWYAKKYTAKGHIAVVKTSCIHYSYAKDNGCTWAQIDFTRSWCCATGAEVYSRSDGNGHQGFYHAACSMTGAIPSDLMMQLAGGGDSIDNSLPTTPNAVTFVPGTQDVSSDPEFHDNDTITISKISIKLSSDINDPNENTYTLAVWIPQDDTINGIEDTVYTAAKSVSAGTITLQGGILTVSGDIFSKKDFNLIQNGDVTEVTYVGGDKKVIVPSNIDEDDLEISSFGDIDVKDAVSMLYKTTEANNGIISGDMEISLYPNPVVNTLNLSISSQKDDQIDFLLYDIKGKLIKESPKHTVSLGENQLSLNVAGLAPGQYFMLAKGNGIKVIKRFIKE